MESFGRIVSSGTEIFGIVKEQKKQTREEKKDLTTEVAELRDELLSKIEEIESRLENHEDIIEDKLDVPIRLESKKKRVCILTFQVILDILFVAALVFACGYSFINDIISLANREVMVNRGIGYLEYPYKIPAIVTCPFLQKEVDMFMRHGGGVPWEFEIRTFLEIEDSGVTVKMYETSELIKEVKIPADHRFPIPITCFVINGDMDIIFENSTFAFELGISFIMENSFPYNETDGYYQITTFGDLEKEKAERPDREDWANIIDGEFLSASNMEWLGSQFGNFFTKLTEERRTYINGDSDVLFMQDGSPTKIETISCSSGDQEIYADSSIVTNKCAIHYDTKYEVTRYYDDVEEYYSIRPIDPFINLGGIISFVGSIIAVVNAICIVLLSKTYDFGGVVRGKINQKKKIGNGESELEEKKDEAKEETEVLVEVKDESESKEEEEPTQEKEEEEESTKVEEQEEEEKEEGSELEEEQKEE